MGYFIVTGATSGIGQDISEILAQRGFSLILVARNNDRLQAWCAELSKRYQIEALALPVDLSEPGSALKVYRSCQPYGISGIVNNAGMGLFGDFSSIGMEAEQRLLQLNVISVHELSKYFLKDFLAADTGMILNVASTAAFQAGPYMASYYASKAYVLSLTEAMAEEVAHLGKDVTVSCLAPGPVKTEFHQRAGLKAGGAGLQSSRAVAKYGINEWFKGTVLIVPGKINRFLLFVNRFVSRRFGRQLVLKNQLKKKDF